MAAKGQKGIKISIRVAALKDAGRLAELSTQLGYPASRDDVERRMTQVKRSLENVVYVAALQDGQVIGWVHAFVYRLLETDSRVEIGGLVVDERHRRLGAGRLLMRQTEQWARKQGCKTINLRTNVLRNDAHVFYQSLGYNLVKTQHAFRKGL